MKTTRQENFDEFMRGFAQATGLDIAHATEQWAGFSRQLSDEDLTEVESGGYSAGLKMAEDWKEMFPTEDDWEERHEAFTNEGEIEP